MSIIIFVLIALRNINLKRLFILLFLNGKLWLIWIPFFNLFPLFNLKSSFNIIFFFNFRIRWNIINTTHMVEAETFFFIHLTFFYIFNKLNIFLRCETHETFHFVNLKVFLFLLFDFLQKTSTLLFYLITIILSLFVEDIFFV